MDESKNLLLWQIIMDDLSKLGHHHGLNDFQNGSSFGDFYINTWLINIFEENLWVNSND